MRQNDEIKRDDQMKKKYVRPELIYEQYILNQHMATSCTLEYKGQGPRAQCVAVGKDHLSGITLFVDTNTCGTGRAEVQNYCYYPSVDTLDTLGIHGSGD